MRAELRPPPIKINERTSAVHPLSNDSVFLSLQRERDLSYFATLMQFVHVGSFEAVCIV